MQCTHRSRPTWRWKVNNNRRYIPINNDINLSMFAYLVPQSERRSFNQNQVSRHRSNFQKSTHQSGPTREVWRRARQERPDPKVPAHRSHVVFTWPRLSLISREKSAEGNEERKETRTDMHGTESIVKATVRCCRLVWVDQVTPFSAIEPKPKPRHTCEQTKQRLWKSAAKTWTFSNWIPAQATWKGFSSRARSHSHQESIHILLAEQYANEEI